MPALQRGSTAVASQPPTRRLTHCERAWLPTAPDRRICAYAAHYQPCPGQAPVANTRTLNCCRPFTAHRTFTNSTPNLVLILVKVWSRWSAASARYLEAPGQPEQIMKVRWSSR
jgi:hypothetical protein